MYRSCLTLIMFMHVLKQTKPNMSGRKSEIFPDCNFLFVGSGGIITLSDMSREFEELLASHLTFFEFNVMYNITNVRNLESEEEAYDLASANFFIISETSHSSTNVLFDVYKSFEVHF